LTCVADIGMATGSGTIDLLLDSLGAAGARYRTRRMFGEYCLYRDGRPVALVCDDELFVKDTPSGRAVLAQSTDVVLGAPFPGARPHLRLPPDLWDDGDRLCRLLDATALALPQPKPRRMRTGKPAR
jgi:DNA transformation protein